MRVKRIIALCLAMLMMAAFLPVHVSANTVSTVERTFSVDGFEITTDVVVSGNAVLVPFSFLEEAVGAIATYNPRNRQISILTARYTFRLTVGNVQYTRQGVNRRLSAAPILVGGVPFVPMREIITGIGGTFDVNLATSMIEIVYFSNMTGSVIVSGSTTLVPFMQDIADRLNAMNTGLTINVSGGGSGAGRNAVIDRTTHVGMDSGTPNATQRAAIRHFIPVAFDAVAIVTHPSNPVANLTTEQARSIFMGEITNWNQVGGNNAPIIVHIRDGLSGTGDVMQSELLGSGNAFVAGATPHASNGLQRNATAGDANAIAFLSIGYVDNTVRAVTLNGVAPTFETVASGAYVLNRNLNLLSLNRPTGSSARLIDFVRSAQGQSIIYAAEFLPIRPLF